MTQKRHDEGVQAGDIDHVLGELQALEERAGNIDPTELARLQAEAIARLKAMEFALRNDLEPDRDNQLVLSGTDDVPTRYRRLVEVYYRALSQGAP